MARSRNFISDNWNQSAKTESWLRGQSRETAAMLSTRAALRALPLIGANHPPNRYAPARFATIVLPCFRGAVVAWTGAQRSFESTDQDNFKILNRAAVDAQEITGKIKRIDPCINAITNAVRAVSFIEINFVAQWASRALRDAVSAFRNPDIITRATDLDAAKIDGRDLGKATNAARLAKMPLWPEAVDETAARAWSRLRSEFIAVGDDWDVWVDWYEDRLTGRPSLGSAFDFTVATLPDELWQQEPAAVNARIKELITEHTLPTLIPAQGAGPHFALNPDLKIALAPPVEIDSDGNNLGRIRRLLPQVRQAAGDLAGHVSPNSQPEISRNLAQYREAIAGEPETIAWGTVFGLGVRLENAATAARRDIANRLQEPLEDAAQEALDSVLTLHGPLILATAEGRELSEQADQFRLTREEQAALREAAQSVAEAFKNSNLAEASATRLTEEAVETIGEGRHPERGAVFGLATIKNLATLLVPAGVLGAVHGAIAHLVGGDFGVAAGAGAAGLLGFGLAELQNVRLAARSLGADFVQLIDVAGDQADLARAQAIARLRLLTPFRDFVTRNEEPLRQIAQNSSQLRWALRYIDFIVRTN